MESSVSVELFIALGILLLFGGVVALMFRRARRQRQVLQEHGLVPQPAPDPALVERMRRLMPEKQVKNVYVLNRGAYQFYHFQLWSEQGQDDAPGARHTAALISADFHLPRFLLFPNLQAPPLLGGLTHWAVQQFTDRLGFQRIAFPDCAAFDAAHMLLGAQEEPLRQFFDRERLTRLAQLKYVQIDARDDLLVFSLLAGPARPEDLPERDPISRLLETAAQLYAIFR